MERDAFHIRLSHYRRVARAGGGHRLGAQGPRADLDDEAGNSRPLARPHRKHFGLCQGARLSRRGKPGTMARPSRQAVAARAKVREVEHHAALPYAELPAFLASLREQEGIAARALEFLILTAARTGEVIGARWSEIDLLDKTWTVPAARMKAHREHRVPLSARALAILDEMQAVRDGDTSDAFMFPGGKPGKPLSNMAFLMLLRRIGRGDLTAHGFRATFKTWASERISFQNEISRGELGACDRRKSRASLYAWRHVRQAATAHAAMGDVLHHRSRWRRTEQGRFTARFLIPSPCGG